MSIEDSPIKIGKIENGKKPNLEEIQAESLLSKDQKMEKLFSYREYFIRHAANFVKNNQADADDIVSNAYVKALQSINDFNHKSTLKTWFSHIVHNEALNFIRRVDYRKIKASGQLPHISDDTEIIERHFVDGGITKEDDMIAQEESLHLSQAVRSLKPKYRDALESTIYGGMTNQEAIKNSSLSINAHKSRKLRALEQVHSFLKKRGFIN